MINGCGEESVEEAGNRMQKAPRTMDIAILGAVPREVDALRKRLTSARTIPLAGGALDWGTLGGRSVLLGAGGLGKVNAATVTTAVLQSFSVREVWNIGCAGAYHESGLTLGDVVLTRRFLFGDEGVLTRDGVLSLEEIGIPVLVRKEEPFYDRLPADPDPAGHPPCARTPPGCYRLSAGPLPAVARPVPETGGAENDPRCFRLVHGSSLTVGMSSGDAYTARVRFQRYGADTENMEGSAVAQVCARFGVPMIECRGISNVAGERRKDFWRLDAAISHCHGIILNWIEA